MPLCPHCNKEYTVKGLGTHIWRNHGDGKTFNPNKPGKVAWNKGLTKETDERIKLQSNALKQSYDLGVFPKWQHSPEGLKKLSEFAKSRGLGGYRPHPNKGSRYKDIWFDSKWEIQVAQILDENLVEWIRPKTGFIWTDDGRKYYPDFYLPKYDIYLDPKNDYLIKQDELKISEASKRNNIRVFILNKQQLNWTYIQTLL
jgi:hypothetical protein